MKKIYFVLPLIFLGSLTNSIAQEIDSLWRVYQNESQPDTNRLSAIYDIAWGYVSSNPDTAIVIAKEQLLLSQKTKQKAYEAKAYNAIGRAYMNKGDYPTALDNHFKALELREALHDKKGMSGSYNNLGVVYDCQSNYPKALEYYLKALKIRLELKDMQGLGASYNNVGVVYENLSNFPKALEYHLKALKIKQDQGDEQGVSNAYNNISIVYKDEHNLKKALEFALKALAISEKLDDKKGIGVNSINIGNMYANQHDFTNALKHLTHAIDVLKEINDQNSLANAYSYIASIHNDMHNYSEALKFGKLSLKEATAIGAIGIQQLAFQQLSIASAGLNNYREAYTHHLKFKQLTDSIFNADNSKQLGDLKTNFEVEKKSTELKLKAEAEQEKLKIVAYEEKKKQQIIIAAITGTLLIVIGFSIVLYKRFRVTNKQKKIIELKEQETQQQKHIIEEKQKEIIDSIAYAKRLQEAILPPQAFVSKHCPENFILYKPKDLVAGDFYWMEVMDEMIFVAAADSTGHGVPGAMVSVVCSNALNRAVKEFALRKTGEILDKCRQLVFETFEKSSTEVKDGMDISLLCIHPSTKSISWSGANNPLWYIQQGELSVIKADKQPIGKTDTPLPFTTHEISYSEGTIFYLFTDGYADQFGGEKGKKFKYKPFQELLIANYTHPLNEQCNRINKEFDQWKGKLEQVDDVCVMGIKI